jgi:hypothetical protein
MSKTPGIKQLLDMQIAGQWRKLQPLSLNLCQAETPQVEACSTGNAVATAFFPAHLV